MNKSTNAQETSETVEGFLLIFLIHLIIQSFKIVLFALLTKILSIIKHTSCECLIGNVDRYS